MQDLNCSWGMWAPSEDSGSAARNGRKTNAARRGQSCNMMNGGMDSMMGGVMGFGWLPMLIGLALIIGGIVLLVRMLTPSGSQAASGTSNIVLTVLAVCGGGPLVGVLAMGTARFGTRRSLAA